MTLQLLNYTPFQTCLQVQHNLPPNSQSFMSHSPFICLVFIATVLLVEVFAFHQIEHGRKMAAKLTCFRI